MKLTKLRRSVDIIDVKMSSSIICLCIHAIVTEVIIITERRYKLLYAVYTNIQKLHLIHVHIMLLSGDSIPADSRG